jgi:sulfatase maturation enzyme AslB (radical SAM superfamily)
VGTSTLWFAFHGAGTTHDRAVQRQGAYHESLRAVELAQQAGMRAGCNLFVTNESLPQVEQIVADLQRAGIEEIIPCLYAFLPNARGHYSERVRSIWPQAEEFVKLLDTIPETANWRRFWHELPHKHTEAWYVQQALAGTWPTEPELRAIWLVCRPNLDVYRGWAGYYRQRYGNLRRDGVDVVLSRAMADGPRSADEIWLTGEQQASIWELAARFGQQKSQRIHPHAASIRYWWVECARRAGSADLGS